MANSEFVYNFSWYCPNCGEISMGYRDEMDTIKVECQRCHAVMVRRTMSRRHARFDVYSPVDDECQVST